MTYLQIVNNILKRLRERTVSTVNETAYSEMIGILVNDAKHEIEEAWDWNAFKTTLTASTVQNVLSYELDTANQNFTTIDVINDTSNFIMKRGTTAQFNKWYLTVDPANTGSPTHYNYNGVDADNNVIVDIYPKPDGVYNLRFNLFIRPEELSTDTDTLLIPDKPVIMLAYAKAIEERGEDGGQAAASAYATALRLATDAIAYDANKNPEELIFTTV